MSASPAPARRLRLPRLDAYQWLLLAAMVVYVVVFARLAFQIHAGMRTHKADLGQFDQAIWNSSQGRFLQQTDGGGISTRMTDHVEPILVLISPVLLAVGRCARASCCCRSSGRGSRGVAALPPGAAIGWRACSRNGGAHANLAHGSRCWHSDAPDGALRWRWRGCSRRNCNPRVLTEFHAVPLWLRRSMLWAICGRRRRQPPGVSSPPPWCWWPSSRKRWRWWRRCMLGYVGAWLAWRLAADARRSMRAQVGGTRAGMLSGGWRIGRRDLAGVVRRGDLCDCAPLSPPPVYGVGARAPTLPATARWATRRWTFCASPL
jgi:hypothetical protein